jgi:hypothetical protein
MSSIALVASATDVGCHLQPLAILRDGEKVLARRDGLSKESVQARSMSAAAALV